MHVALAHRAGIAALPLFRTSLPPLYFTLPPSYIEQALLRFQYFVLHFILYTSHFLLRMAWNLLGLATAQTRGGMSCLRHIFGRNVCKDGLTLLGEQRFVVCGWEFGIEYLLNF